jgi:hypothetical protein
VVRMDRCPIRSRSRSMSTLWDRASLWGSKTPPLV